MVDQAGAALWARGRAGILSGAEQSSESPMWNFADEAQVAWACLPWLAGHPSPSPVGAGWAPRAAGWRVSWTHRLAGAQGRRWGRTPLPAPPAAARRRPGSEVGVDVWHLAWEQRRQRLDRLGAQLPQAARED